LRVGFYHAALNPSTDSGLQGAYLSKVFAD